MRSLLVLIGIGVLSAPVPVLAQANPDRIPTAVRDCLSGQEFGTPGPAPRAGATYLFVTSTMFEGRDGRYGSLTSWQAVESLQKACSVTLEESAKELEDRDAAITGLVVTLVPDVTLKRGLSH